MQFTARDGAIHEVIFGTPIRQQGLQWEVLVRFPDWHENILIYVQGGTAQEARADAEEWVKANLDFHVALHRPGPALGQERP